MKTLSVHVCPNKNKLRQHSSLPAGHEQNYKQLLASVRNMAKKNLPTHPKGRAQYIYGTLW